MARKPMSRDDAARRKAEIAARARRCFAVNGYRGSTVEALERACGVTRGTLFRYFSSKSALLAAILDEEARSRRATFENLLRQDSGPTDLRQALALALAAQIRRSREDPDALRFRLEAVKLAGDDRRLSQRIRTLEDDERRWRQALVSRLAANGWPHPDWPVAAATDVVSTVLVGLAVQLSFGFPSWSDDAAHADALARALAALLSQPPVPAAPRAHGVSTKRTTSRRTGGASR